ncbi:hypothetical protein ABDJ41_12715 [Pedobacter sp. ASV1-7]|uniref:hypothetical protein n=1 Tax=Pedobacter sp. ASV1-7 TaxID=3145237 RepID=UPI0032E85ED0
MLTYTVSVFGIKDVIFVVLSSFIAMSNEILEISVLVDEKFDVKFESADGVLGFILRIFGR